jgi:hypothetical protein
MDGNFALAMERDLTKEKVVTPFDPAAFLA